jgi:hypothetical protein
MRATAGGPLIVPALGRIASAPADLPGRMGHAIVFALGILPWMADSRASRGPRVNMVAVAPPVLGRRQATGDRVLAINSLLATSFGARTRRRIAPTGPL